MLKNNRQTGRTTRMLKEAVALASTGAMSIVIVHTEADATNMRTMLKEKAELLGVPPDKVLNIVFTVASTIAGGMDAIVNDCAVHDRYFIDHNVVHNQLNGMLTIFNKYNLKENSPWQSYLITK